MTSRESRQSSVVSTYLRTHLVAIATLLMLGLLVITQNAFADHFSKGFKHDKTGYILEGRHEHIKCDSCHKSAVFKGTPTQCDGCHVQSSNIATSITPTNHVATVNNKCDDCHEGETWVLSHFDHDAYPENCVSCHNGAIAGGKPPTHSQGSNVCEECHNSGAWSDTNHPEVTQPCKNCHNGVIEKGMDADHFDIGDLDCDQCHSIGAWVPAVMDHGIVDTSNCLGAGCHDSENDDLHPKINPGLNCDECHTNFLSWAWDAPPFDHGLIDATDCLGCHDTGRQIDRRPKDARHNNLPPGQQCSDCHSTTAWKPANIDHAEFDLTSCYAAGCHDDDWASAQSKRPHGYIMTPPGTNCDVCHQVLPFLWKSGARMDHDYTNPPGLCGTECHDTNEAPDGHPAILPSECTDCHPAIDDWSIISMQHDLLLDPNTCTSCHGSGGKWPKTPTKVLLHNNILAGVLCEDCHTDAETEAWDFPRPVEHNFLRSTGNCNICHNEGIEYAPSFPADSFLVHSNRAPAAHCDACHNSTDPQDWGNWSMTDGNHSDGLSSAAYNDCERCHGTGFDYDRLSAISDPLIVASHISSNWQPGTRCIDCHTNAVRWAPLQMDHDYAKDGPNDCVLCHTTRPTPATPEHTNLIVGTLCTVCHNPAAADWIPVISPMDHSVFQTPDACGTLCHTTTPDGHLAGVDGDPCLDCHESTADWKTLTYNHTGPDFPGAHSNSKWCIKCHKANDANQVTYKDDPALKPDCGGCHANKFYDKQRDHKKVKAKDSDPVIPNDVLWEVEEAGLRKCDGVCHEYANETDAGNEVNPTKTKNGEHDAGDW